MGVPEVPAESSAFGAAQSGTRRRKARRNRRGGHISDSTEQSKPEQLRKGDLTIHVSCPELQDDLKMRLDLNGFENTYDFLWVPLKRHDKRRRGKPIMHGYAWVNFTSTEHAHRAKKYFEDEFRGERIVARCRFQGAQALKDNLHGKNHPNDGWPLVMHRGHLVPADTIPGIGAGAK